MCGILVLWGSLTHLQKSLDALRPRGPDVTHHEILVLPSDLQLAIGFTRLHIQGSATLEQPYHWASDRLVCNGEIFNDQELRARLDLDVPDGASDCAVIPELVKRYGMRDTARQLDGDFAIAHVDLQAETIMAARDPYGVRPLYFATGPDWSAIASELKAFPSDATTVREIAPGSILTISLSNGPIHETQWHEVPWLKVPAWSANPTEGIEALRIALTEAVAKRLHTVRAVGACLSGGLDSSLVAALAAKQLGGQRLHTYSVGMEGSKDLEHARLVAAHIGSIHHERILTPEECLAVIPEVVCAIESFDITTVRASVGNYLVGRLVATETPDVKVVLNGDGADEVLGGYLYMRAAPDDVAFETETDRLLREIHRYDVLRSERSMAAHGLESRSPFLDRQFVSVARSLPTDLLRPGRLEKWPLREAFKDTGLLPDSVLWRRKEAFSDGISQGAGRSWFEMAREEGARRMAASGPKNYAINPPPTPEARWYRELFHESYPQIAAAMIPAMWMPRFIAATDPSARTLNLYTQ